MPFHAQTIAAAIAPSREQIAAIDCSFIGKSGKQTWGIDNFYNGSISKSQKGWEISVIAVVDVSAHQGYTLSVKQTATTDRQTIPLAQPIAKKKRKKKKRKSKSKSKSKATAKTAPVISERVKGYLEQLKTARVNLPTAVKYLTADSFYSKKSVVDGVIELDLHLISKLRIDKEGVWGKLPPAHFRADLRYCYTGEQKPKGAPRKYDGKVDLSDLSRLDVSGKLADAKLEQQTTHLDTGEDSQPQSFSMATYKRLALNAHLLELFISMLGLDPTLIKSHPNYDLLLQYGSLAP